MPAAAGLEAFITRWQASGGAERANDTLFLTEFCHVVGVLRPAPATGGLGDDRFERAVTRHEADGSTRRLRRAPRGDKLPRMLANLEALGLARSL